MSQLLHLPLCLSPQLGSLKWQRTRTAGVGESNSKMASSLTCLNGGESHCQLAHLHVASPLWLSQGNLTSDMAAQEHGPLWPSLRSDMALLLPCSSHSNIQALEDGYLELPSRWQIWKNLKPCSEITTLCVQLGIQLSHWTLSYKHKMPLCKYHLNTNLALSSQNFHCRCKYQVIVLLNDLGKKK